MGETMEWRMARTLFGRLRFAEEAVLNNQNAISDVESGGGDASEYRAALARWTVKRDALRARLARGGVLA